MIGFLAPGQGSQTPGMLAPWLDDAALASLLGEWSDAAGIDLVTLGTTADAETITDTANAQPLIVAASLLSATALLGDLPPADAVVAGHSVGELTALAVAGVISPADAVTLAARRGRAMADAAALADTGMSAVVGGMREDVLAAIEAAGATPANINSDSQVVAAGTREQLDVLAAHAPARARVIPLKVAGAFHTGYMASAYDSLHAAASALDAADPAIRLLSNRDGEVVSDGRDALARIVTQLTSPVRWDLCSRTLASMAPAGLVEFAPAGVLTGLARRAHKGVPVVAISSPEDLDPARELVGAA